MPAERVQQADNHGQAIAWTALVKGSPLPRRAGEPA